MAKEKNKLEKKSKKTKRKAALTARNADRHALYENSVQAVDAEIDFVDQTFTELRDRRAVRLREDFCGTGNTSCEWVRRRASNVAIGVDLDEEVMEWGRRNHIAKLKSGARKRIELVNSNVLDVDVGKQDIVLAMNFSYWIFRERLQMREYFAGVRRSLVDDGIFFMDCFGGYEAFTEMKEHTEHEDYTYTWHQATYNPVSGEMSCHIHFKFNDGSRLKKAFSYDWRLWTLPELRDLLAEVGFSKTTVYWQGWDEDEETGSGEFYPAEDADADAGWLCYIVAER